MAFEPFDWNVVVAGAWNRAILTPMGIGRRLFGREDDTQLHIEVALDDGRSRVREEGLIVGVVPGRLVIDTEEPSLDSLNRAREMAIRAMQELPETPFQAAGMNIRYRSEEIPPALLDLLAPPIDRELAQRNLRIESREVSRRLTFNEGHLNLRLVFGSEENCELLFNFHRDGQDRNDLIGWLETPMAEVVGQVDVLLEVLGVCERVEDGA